MEGDETRRMKKRPQMMPYQSDDMGYHYGSMPNDRGMGSTTGRESPWGHEPRTRGRSATISFKNTKKIASIDDHIRVYIAETGQKVLLSVLSLKDTIKKVKQYIAFNKAIPEEQQIFINVKGNTVPDHYSIVQFSKENIYLFHREKLQHFKKLLYRLNKICKSAQIMEDIQFESNLIDQEIQVNPRNSTRMDISLSSSTSSVNSDLTSSVVSTKNPFEGLEYTNKEQKQQKILEILTQENEYVEASLRPDDVEKYLEFNTTPLESIKIPEDMKQYQQNISNSMENIYVDDDNQEEKMVDQNELDKKWKSTQYLCYVHTKWANEALKFSQEVSSYTLDLLKEQEKQLEAVKAAIYSLEGPSNTFEAKTTQFTGYFQRFTPEFKTLLEEFDTLLNALKEIPVDQNLVKLMRQEPKTLYDCIPVEALLKWKAKCERDFQSFTTKIDRSKIVTEQLRSDRQALQEDTKGEKLKPNGEEIQTQIVELKKKITRQCRYLNSEYHGVFAIEKDDQVEIESSSFDSLTDASPRSFSAWMNQLQTPEERAERIKEITDLKEHREQMIKDLLKQVDELIVIKRKVYDTKVKITFHFHKMLYRVSEYQYRIKKLQKRQSSYISVLMTLHDHFAQLAIVRRFPSLYQISLLELKRRKKFYEKYEARLKTTIDLIGTLSQIEMKRQTRYAKNIASLLPQTFLPELAMCKVPDEKALRAELLSHNVLPDLPDVNIDPILEKSNEEIEHLSRLFSKTGFPSNGFERYYGNFFPSSDDTQAPHHQQSSSLDKGYLLSAPGNSLENMSMFQELNESVNEPNAAPQKLIAIRNHIDTVLSNSDTLSTSDMELALSHIRGLLD